jgi:hypothetical protein
MEMQRQKVIPLVKAACIFLWLFLRVAYLLILVEGLGEVTRGGGEGVNGSLIKLFYKNWPMSQVQTTKPKPYKKVNNTPTNNIEMIPLKLRMQWIKNGINWTPGYQYMAKTCIKHCC